MAFQSDIAGAQIDGARDYQEDAFLITNLTDANGNASALIIVADGMGGHAAGNVASNMAVQAFNKSITTLYPTDAISESLNVSILKANAAIAETVKETPALDAQEVEHPKNAGKGSRAHTQRGQGLCSQSGHKCCVYKSS